MLEIETKHVNETLERTIAYLLEQIDVLKNENMKLSDELEAEKRNMRYWWGECQKLQGGEQECLKAE